MQFKIRRMFQLCVLVGAAITTSSSYGAMTNKMLLDVLLENGAITQAQHDKLLLGSKEEEKKSADEVIVKLDKGALKFETKDGDFKARIGGRIYVDSAWYSNSRKTFSDGTKLELGNGTEVRSARLFMSGTVWENWHYKGQYDFAENDAKVKDAYIRYTGLDSVLGFPLDLTVGHFKEPFTLEDNISSKYISFMERALPVGAFRLNRNIGFTAKSYGKVMEGGWATHAGIFGTGVDDPDDGNNEGYGWVGRGSFAPIAKKDIAFHIGASVEYRKLKGEEFKLRSRPEAHTADERLVSATFNDPDTIFRYGIETSGVWGPFSAQAEYIAADVDSNSEPTEPGGDFDGWYAYMTWFLTGESRPYKAKDGSFGRVKPNTIVGKGGWGAWEVATRFSYLNLNDGLVKGGREKNWTFGLNWYATPNIRFMANYILTDVDRSFDDRKQDISPNIFQVRGQVDF